MVASFVRIGAVWCYFCPSEIERKEKKKKEEKKGGEIVNKMVNSRLWLTRRAHVLQDIAPFIQKKEEKKREKKKKINQVDTCTKGIANGS